ncbi:MAG: nuclear transport factor 2 family protein [Rhodobacteraceae bacterium]|nr:nuclear transport factor 2 family protein [Paracoccaceae bacterium]
MKKYSDFTDFILGITHEIWEQRHVSSLRQLYAEDIPVRSPSSVVVGNENVIAATLATLNEFPDRQLFGEDVIWDRTGGNSWLSSHRIYSTATHLGEGAFGQASGKRVGYRIIADCHAEACPERGWKINDEWLVRDLGAITRCLGMSAEEFALIWLDNQELDPSEVRFAGHRPGDGTKGPYQGQGNQSGIGRAYGELLQSIMGDDLSVIKTRYDRACEMQLPGGGAAHGIDQCEAFWFSLKSAFPRAEFELRHIIGREDAGMPPRAAIRWSLTGKHDGYGMFGEPSGAEVHVMGISHAEFGPRGLRREFILFDEVAIWQQILIGVDTHESGNAQ